MRSFKLIKSMSLVSYPLYNELVKIRKSTTSFVNVLISTVVGVLLDKSPLSGYILDYIAELGWLNINQKIALVGEEDAKTFLSIAIAFLLFLIAQIIYFIYNSWGSNKNTRSKREKLAYEFYNIVIPKLIEVKSLVEQAQEATSEEKNKKKLLLLQALYNMREFSVKMMRMRIIETKQSGVTTKNSKVLLDIIGRSAYSTVCNEMQELNELIESQINSTFDVNTESDVTADICSLKFADKKLFSKLTNYDKKKICNLFHKAQE